MEITAITKSAQVAPRKIRIVADVVRKQSIDDALVSLSFLRKRGADVLERTLRNAIANAIDKKLTKENLFIKSIDVSEGASYKRFHPSTRGRVHPYKKRTTHVRITLSEKVQKLKEENKK